MFRRDVFTRIFFTVVVFIGSGCAETAKPLQRAQSESTETRFATLLTADNQPSATEEVPAAQPMNKVDLVEADWSGIQSLIAENQGKIVVVDIWSTACEPCMREFPHLIALQQRYPKDVVAISFDVDFVGIKNKPPAFYRERVLKFLGSQVENNVLHRLSTISTDDLFPEIKLDSIPAVFVYGRDGSLLKRFDGPGSDGDGEGVSYEKQVVPFVGNLVSVSTSATSPEVPEIETYVANDTLNPGDELSDDAKMCLAGLIWKPESFEVTVKPNRHPLDPAIVRFPSPRPTGVAINDQVALEWYSAKNDRDEIIGAPAIVVVHESGSGMVVGRLIAKALHAQGLHAFMIQLPTYGLRRLKGVDSKPKPEQLDAVMKQGIADTRRARDAVAILPHVDARSISLQGTSLGGIVTATTAGLDRGFSTVHIMVSGGNLYELVSNGNREAGRLRDDLAKAGITDDKLKQLFAPIEPLRLAHRYDRRNTWLYTASRDQVIPPQHAEALREAAGLDKDHEMIMNADHYTGIVFVPIIVADIAKKIRDELTSRSL